MAWGDISERVDLESAFRGLFKASPAQVEEPNTILKGSDGTA